MIERPTPSGAARVRLRACNLAQPSSTLGAAGAAQLACVLTWEEHMLTRCEKSCGFTVPPSNETGAGRFRHSPTTRVATRWALRGRLHAKMAQMTFHRSSSCARPPLYFTVNSHEAQQGIGCIC